MAVESPVLSLREAGVALIDCEHRTPPAAESVAQLRQLPQVASAGVVFTTIQKFLPDEKGGRMPALSGRHNIVVIADEAHRRQYDMIDGLARHMRDAWRPCAATRDRTRPSAVLLMLHR